ncbi:ATP-binding cassette domain-containing protein [Halorientalis sp.]|uniref:ATP-binding cassette domain-containing protein n=1 Tax=Halorientalis sp. TaxID=1931229 RepID=UPI00262A361E|nr:ATP-binding cassette domain-containing protein [Halorientalis sp.]
MNAYYGNSHVPFDLDLEVAENEVVAPLGHNGAGRTTTLRSVTGTAPRREGTTAYQGTSIENRSVDRISNTGI